MNDPEMSSLKKIEKQSFGKDHIGSDYILTPNLHNKLIVKGRQDVFLREQ